jgi:Fe-S-cluster containining protein
MTKLEYPQVRWRCLLCSRCCRDQPGRERKILLTDHDVKRIVGSGAGGDFYDQAEPNGPYKYQMKLVGGHCVFLLNDRCTIYEARPLVCRFYPFTMIEQEGYIFQVDYACPGLGSGRVVTKKDLVKLLEEAKNSLSDSN